MGPDPINLTPLILRHHNHPLKFSRFMYYVLLQCKDNFLGTNYDIYFCFINLDRNGVGTHYGEMGSV